MRLWRYNMRQTVHFDKELNYENNKKEIICDFVKFCCQCLDMNNKSFAVYIKSKRGGSEPIVTTAAYDPNSKKCYVYGKERATVDVCRSIAHEMTHMMQDFNGDLVGLIKDVGGFHEDQANAKAGEIIKRYAYSNKDRMKIYENYSKFTF
tara:strand:- start:348 stop:797 length:450 start_codon:yes stop_codon:yes gene_type:complete